MALTSEPIELLMARLRAICLSVEDAAEAWLYASFALNLVATLAVIVLLLLSIAVTSVIIWLGYIPLAASIGGYVATVRMDQLYGLAREGKRLQLWAEGLGPTATPSRLIVDLIQRAPGRSTRRAKLYEGEARNYYSSGREASFERLAELVEESAFFSAFLYARVRRLLLGVLIIVAVTTMGGLLVLVMAPTSSDFRTLIGRVVLTAIPAIATLGVAWWALKLANLESGIRRVLDGLADMAAGDANMTGSIVRMADEYNCQMAQGLPIPNAMYGRHRARLNELWALRKASYSIGRRE